MTLSIDKILTVWYSALFPHIQRDRRRSAVKQKTLQELSELALRVAGKMASLEKVVTPEAFDELREDINWLETAAPRWDAVREVRVRWYEHGLASFETCFVQPAATRLPGWESWDQNACGGGSSPPGLIMHYVTLSFFLRRCYLGEEFARIFPRCLRALDSIIESIDQSAHPGLYQAWKDRRDQLWNYLLDGRL